MTTRGESEVVSRWSPTVASPILGLCRLRRVSKVPDVGPTLKRAMGERE